MQCSKFNSKFGEIVILWNFIANKVRIKRIFLSNSLHIASFYQKSIISSAVIDNHLDIDNLIQQFELFLDGHSVQFSLELLDFSVCRPLQEMVIRTEYQIPRGSLSTYQLLARTVGKPRAIRAIARALSQNPFPIVIPCHRVIRSDGFLGGYQGGLEMKRTLLRAEGISSSDTYYIENWKQYLWQFRP